MGAMGTYIGKGLVWLLTKPASGDFAARVIGMAAIYSALGIRDEGLNEKLGRAMMAGPLAWQAVTRLRRDAHEPSPSCWFHADRCCLSSAKLSATLGKCFPRYPPGGEFDFAV
jgi:hypothetical protein